MDSTFSGKGFKNWRKGIDKFKIHEKSTSHAQAVLSFNQLNSPIEQQLSSANAAAQKVAWECLLAIVSSIKYLARQGLALRGHLNDEGNLMELLKTRTEDIPQLREWLMQDRGRMWSF